MKFQSNFKSKYQKIWFQTERASSLIISHDLFSTCVPSFIRLRNGAKPSRRTSLTLLGDHPPISVLIYFLSPYLNDDRHPPPTIRKMARNEEKAQSMLNRFITMKNEEKKKPKERRPFLASECRDLAEADKWRQQIMREIGRKVAEIQNEGLGEHRLRDLNDEINKLIREKSHWERRIVELGGPNYSKQSAKMTDLEGNIVDVPNPSGRGPGYRYFGAAKKLPGVRELFDKPPELRKRRTRYDIYKRIDASYYGYRDDEDGILVKLEGPAEERMRAAVVAEWMAVEEVKREAKRAVKSGEEASVNVNAADILREGEEDVVEEERMAKEIEEREKESEFVVHVPLPDQKEIERMVVEKKKMELLSKYASEDLLEEQVEAKAMLNIQR
ncbi:uncharacterized protein LOC132311959 [Cornus florida]|uniref:uncharacterized protein LOC132311959 n=1 Tax=Cornus florida TaxID=4283 RepID=UPI00289F2890|nr:uncharacterized protein LOC132311959 [Cornus florida]XP_059666122.1 uncharacterized protein LOC132311959 [Cornus florida]XP_059666123.1 uncharacterized protein LOC132311959 [Cornus florida]